jgi:hypothetical protein
MAYTNSLSFVELRWLHCLILFFLPHRRVWYKQPTGKQEMKGLRVEENNIG